MKGEREGERRRKGHYSQWEQHGQRPGGRRELSVWEKHTLTGMAEVKYHGLGKEKGSGKWSVSQSMREPVFHEKW